MPQFIRLDLFPATVTTPEATYSPCRAVVTDDSLLVYMDAAGGPAEVYSVRMDDITGRNTTGYTVTADEEQVTVARAGGCGCGSMLRGFHPFPGIPYQPMLA